MSTPCHGSIDWISATFPDPMRSTRTTLSGKDRSGGITLHELADYDRTTTINYLAGLLPELPFVPGPGRTPYASSFRSEGVTLFVAGPDGSLVEISGKGCAALSPKSILALIATLQETITRIDLALDLETTVDPKSFAEHTDGSPFAVSGHRASQHGVTYYVGSQKSDRYARVYRYFPPHPRHKLLRIEYVFRRHNARIVVEQILKHGLQATIESAGGLFCWSHPAYTLDWREPIPAYKREKRSGSTVYWFYAQVVPAIKRLILTGVLTETDVRDALFG